MRYSEKEKGRKRKYGCKERGVRINLGRDTASAKGVREIWGNVGGSSDCECREAEHRERGR
jgi:hypothetical protein